MLPGLLFGRNLCIFIWLVLIIAFVVGELVSVGLTSIWFAAGALVALLLAAVGAPFGVQMLLFIVVSLACLAATRPLAKRFINRNVQSTNADSLVGQEIRITERVSNIDQTGTAVVRGQEWTVRAADEREILEAGDMARIIGISGVKLIVKKSNSSCNKE